VLNVAPEPAVNSQVYSHRPSAKQNQGGSADDFGSLVDSNAAAADHDVPPPSVQDRAARPADNNNDRPARRDDRNDADPAEDAQQAAPRTGVVTQKAKKSSAHADSGVVKTGLSDGKSKAKTKDDAADGTSTDPSQTPQAAGDVTNPSAVVVAAPATAPQTTVAKSDGKSDATADTATPATGVSAAVAAATSVKDAAAGTDGKATGTKPGIGPAAGHPSSDKSKAGQTQVSADGAASTKAGGDVNATALSAGIVVPQQAAAAPAVTTGVVKTEAVQGIASGKSAKAAVKTTDEDQTDAKPGTDAKSTGNKPDASSANDTNADQSKGDVASAKADKGTVPAAPSHDRHSADAPIAKPDVSFQAALDLQTPSTSQPQTQQQFTVTVAGPAASAQAASIPVPVNGLAVDIATRAAAGNTSFQIRLDPAELGRIDVRLDVDKHGRVTSHLTVDQPATLDMLRKDAPQLQRALEDAGLKTGDGGLQFSLRDQSPQGGQGDSGQGRHSQRLIVSEEISATPQVVGASYGRSSGSSSGVDISI
jgi:chemotaxis protein MotD